MDMEGSFSEKGLQEGIWSIPLPQIMINSSWTLCCCCCLAWALKTLNIH